MTDKINQMVREAGLHIATDVKWMPIIGLEYAERLIQIAQAASNPNREWVDLTPDEFKEACWASGIDGYTGDREQAVLWAINKLKEKNT